ncbi:MAG: hypothetical protein WA140_07170, partial [Geobacteraceae bacterium]
AVSSRNPTALNAIGLVMLSYGIHPPNPTYKINNAKEIMFQDTTVLCNYRLRTSPLAMPNYTP